MDVHNLTRNNTLIPRSICNQDSDRKTAFKVFAHALNIILSLAGNIALCLVVKKNKKLRKTIDFLIVNNALADLVIPVIASPKIISEIITGSKQWQISGSFGDFACKFIYFVIDLCPMVSMLTFVFLTVSRFIAVVFPFQAARASKNLRLYYIVISWGMSILFCAPYFFVIKLGPTTKQCYMSWDQYSHRVYTTLMLTIFIGMPWVILGVMYTIMLHYIRKSARKIPVQTTGAKKRQRVTRRMTLLSFCIVAAFVICWGPYFYLIVAMFYFPHQILYMYRLCYLADFQFAAMLLAFSNATITPSLCLVFVESYRDGLKKLFGLKRNRNSFRSISSATERIRGQRTMSTKKTNDETTFFCTSV